MGQDGMMWASVEAEAEDTKVAAVMEMVGKGNVMTVMVGGEAVVKAECIGCLCNGRLATACPLRPVPEVHMVEVFNSNVGEVCDEYTCHACDSDANARKVIIIDSGSSAHMFSDWRVLATFAPRLEYKCGVRMDSGSRPLVWAT